jgi:hypothetical protein
MSLLTPTEFRERYDSETLQRRLLDRPVASLRDIQYLYGQLYTMGGTGSGEYAAYLTPDAAVEAFDDDATENIIAAQVDLSQDPPQLDPEEPVFVTTYTDDLVEKLAHCYYASRGSGIDHSLSHLSSKSGNEPEKLGKYLHDRLRRWPTEDAVQEVLESHEDGSLISGLVEAGNLDDSKEKLVNAVTERIGGKRVAMLTVRIRTEAGGQYHWPGEFEVFNEAMKAQRGRKLASKGLGSKTAAGHGVDMVTDTDGTVVGTMSDPLNYYLTQQREKFTNLDRSLAWQSHPITEEAAVSIGNSTEFLEACTYRMYHTKVYALPYFVGSLTTEMAYTLYDWLYEAFQLDKSGDRSYDPIEHGFDLAKRYMGENSPLRFYTVAADQPQASLTRVYGESMSATALGPLTIRDSHNKVLDWWPFDSNNRTQVGGGLPTMDNISLLSELKPSDVTSGWYLKVTFPKNDTERGEGTPDPTPDDDRIETLLRLFSNQAVHIDLLLRNYVERIVDSGRDTDISITVAAQFAQLSALADAGLVDSNGSATPDADLLAQGPYFSDLTMTDEAPNSVVVQHEKINAILEDTPAFEHPERRAAFLLGTLVGAVGNRQSWKYDRSTTLVDQYPVDSISAARFKRISHEALEKTITYSRQDGRNSTLFEWIIDPLRETLLRIDVDQIGLSKDDLRFHYALGVTYGMNDRMPSTSDDESADETATEATQ